MVYNFNIHKEFKELQAIRVRTKFVSSMQNLRPMAILRDFLRECLYNKRMETTNTEVDTVEAIRGLTSELPLNDFGMPLGIYRADLLPFHDYVAPSELRTPSATPLMLESDTAPRVGDGSSEDEHIHDPVHEPVKVDPDPSLNGNGVDAAADVSIYRIAGFPAAELNQSFVPLQYDEGFPAFHDGAPFWTRLSYEPQEAYAAFNQYLSMSLGFVGDPEDDEDYGYAAKGTRSLNDLVARMHPRLRDELLLQQIDAYRRNYYLYYWNLRAKAYDLFRVVEFRHQTETRALETQDSHYLFARKLRCRIEAYMDTDENFMDFMTPKVAVDVMKMATGLERISVNLPAAGPAPDGRAQPTTFELAYRTYAQTARGEDASVVSVDGIDILEGVLNDPTRTRLLQELIIKSGGSGGQ